MSTMLSMTRTERATGFASEDLAMACEQGRMQHSIAKALLTIAAARAERDAPPVHAARQHLAAVYGATRLRRRLERETAAG